MICTYCGGGGAEIVRPKGWAKTGATHRVHPECLRAHIEQQRRKKLARDARQWERKGQQRFEGM